MLICVKKTEDRKIHLYSVRKLKYVQLQMPKIYFNLNSTKVNYSQENKLSRGRWQNRKEIYNDQQPCMACTNLALTCSKECYRDRHTHHTSTRCKTNIKNKLNTSMTVRAVYHPPTYWLSIKIYQEKVGLLYIAIQGVPERSHTLLVSK